MKNIIITLLSIYQVCISPLIHALFGVSTGCRYTVSCSEYAKRCINLYGIYKGSLFATKRLLSCQPFGKIQK